MLVLTARNTDGPIILTDKTTGEQIEIQVLGPDRCQVRLGFQASKNIDIHRFTVYEKIQREKEEG